MNQNVSSFASPRTQSHPYARTGGIYSRAQEKARTMQYAVRSGKPGGGNKRRQCSDGRGDGIKQEEEARGGSYTKIIKKPRLPLSSGASEGEKRSCGYELPTATVRLDVVWIPDNKGHGRDWVKTITFRDLLQQLKKQKIKLLLDEEDETALITEEDVMSDDCNE